ncbi:U3 snoRNP protein [Rhizina undulata]
MKSSGSKKGGTESTRNYSYKSFSQKIANLYVCDFSFTPIPPLRSRIDRIWRFRDTDTHCRKIDPVRRVRRQVDDEETTKSFFHNALETWVDLNLSTTFTEFSREVITLSESLPHIIHYKDKIFDALFTYIDKRDVLSLEPLLDLLAQFAHDLGASFEPYFGRAVTLLSSLVAKHVDVSTIEWTFNCLAYLLKYLSRLLVPDLRSLFDILAPLLGREYQKLFITRFAAEALSFLIRKAREEPLELIVRHAFADLRKNASKLTAKAYPEGLMNMFYEACISVDRTIHSKGPQIFRAMLDIALEIEDTPGPCFGVTRGVLVALIHHTTPETFQPIMEAVYAFIDERILKEVSSSIKSIAVAGRLLYTCVTVRKGNRVTNLEKAGQIVVSLLQLGAGLKEDEEPLKQGMWEVMKAAAVTLQSAELGFAISKCGKIMEKVKEFQGGALFLPFCDLFSELGSERFRTFLLPYFQRFIISQWLAHEDSLCLLIPKLSANDCLNPVKDSESAAADLLGPKSPITPSAIKSIQAFRDAVVKKDEGLNPIAIRTWRYLDVLVSLPISGDSKSFEKLLAELTLLLPLIFTAERNYKFDAIAGKALSLCAKADVKPVNLSCGPLSGVFSELASNPVFLKGVLEYITSPKVALFEEVLLKSVLEKLLSNLTSPSHDVRSLSLACLEILYMKKNKDGNQISEVINLAKIIEETPLTIQNARTIAMYVRKLGAEHAHVKDDPWQKNVVAYYCFGLLTVNFSPVWDDAIKALQTVVETNEEKVAALAFNWLEIQQSSNSPDIGDVEKPTGPLTGYECSNLKAVEAISSKCVMGGFEASAELAGMFEDDLKVSTLSVSVARNQALKLLSEIPQIAERRSRQLVPMFLDWTRMESSGDAVDAVDEAEDIPEASFSSAKWTRKDQISMLTLFSRFVNPKAIYKSETVYAALLNIVASGDTTIQSLALKCIFTWKIPAIRAYENNLNNLLDDTSFRDELTHFVQIDEDESMIQTSHREQLMPVLLRILYGRSLSRKNASSGKKGMESRRIIVLASLANFTNAEKELFIDIALGNLKYAEFVEKTCIERYVLRSEALGSVHVSTRKLVGFVRMMEDMLKQLGSTILPFVQNIMDALFYCLGVASKIIRESDDSMAENLVGLKIAKTIRQGGFKCLNALFTSCSSFHWAPYMPAFFQEFVNPRLPNLPVETSQSPSGLLQLFSTWAGSRNTVMLLTNVNDTILNRIAECLANESIKDEVVLFILTLVQKIIALADSEDDKTQEDAAAVRERLLRPNVDLFLVKLATILQKSPTKEVLEQGIETVAKLAPYISGNTETTHLVNISVFLLNQPSRRVVPRTKSDLLKILFNFLPTCVMEKGDELFEKTFKSVASLFGYFKDQESRITLASVLRVFAERDEQLTEVADLSQMLNSFSMKRLDEPDFEQRLEAYGKINEGRFQHFTPRQWLPLLHNMLFFIKDNEELAIRTNAAYTLKRFAESCGANMDTENGKELLDVMANTILPALRAGTREQSELIRIEFVGVMSHVVKECKLWEEVNDMQPLLVGDDEEANFFNNILHIQQHRRVKALRRLAATAQKGVLRSANVAHFFLPLVEHFVFDQADDAHNLANETIITIGALAEQLSWTQYRALFRRYMGYIKSKPELEKIVVRLIGTSVNSLTRAWTAVAPMAESEEGGEVEGDVDAEGDVAMEGTSKATSCLSQALPKQQKIADDISNGFLPTLMAYLHQKEESTVSLRIPVAVSIVKLLRIMPEDMLKVKLPPVLTDICHILRSRAQEARDMTRRTLTEITTLLGPQYFSFVLKELRGALARGYQLHVLSFTVHSILVSVVPTYGAGDLDYCVGSIVNIIMDDIFGVTGMEKDAEGYINKMKEVKSSKSYDSMDLMASTTTLPYLGDLIRPIQALLKENLNLKMVKKIDELLRRITVGLLKNETVKSRDILIFCYEVIQEAYKANSITPAERKVDEATKRFIVNLKVPSKAASGVATSSHMYKLSKFSLDILRTTLQKHDELMTPENLAGFIPIIGDAVLSKQEEVQISALRLLTTIIKTPLPAIDSGAQVFIAQALAFIRNSPSTNAEIAQASLKLLAAILRERKNVTVKEISVGYILTRIKPDLEEPDRQGVTFNFLKAVLSRKIVIPEVYEVLDNVGTIMVTNQTRSVRDLARGVYFQFLMEYPQGKDRLKKQLGFLAKNLDYQHQSGRHSILEACHLLITKVGDNLIQEINATFFVPLVMVLINDESTECREMAGVLIKKIFERADAERLETFVGLLRNWMEKDGQPLLVRVALQVYGLYFEVYGKRGQKEVSFVSGRLLEILEGAMDDEAEEAVEWELVYFGLQIWIKIVQNFSELALSASGKSIWNAVKECLAFPHSWVRLSAARLIGLLFAAFTKADLAILPLENDQGLKIEEAEMIDIAKAISSQLNSPELSEELGLQVVKNLLFLGRCLYANGMKVLNSLPAVDAELDDLEEEEQEEEKETRTALSWIIGRISGVVRSERNIKQGLLGKKFGLQWLAAMTQVISGEDFVPLADKMIRPLYNLVDLPENHALKDLKNTAQEIMGMIQARMGTTAYTQAYNVVRAEVQERRRERKHKRSIQMVADPERAAKRKIVKHERKKIARKEKSAVFRDARRGKIL